MFQADIVLTPELRKYLRQYDDNNPTKVNDVVQTRKWPNAIVPYVFESGFGKQTIPNLEGFILHFLFIH